MVGVLVAVPLLPLRVGPGLLEVDWQEEAVLEAAMVRVPLVEEEADLVAPVERL